MKNYKVRAIYPEFIEKELNDLGFDKSYLKKALKKYRFNLIKISNLKSPAANILKQTALSKGADLGVASGTVNCVRKTTDAILECTDKQLELIIESLKDQPYNLKKLAIELETFLNNKSDQKVLTVNNKIFRWGEKTFLMGILNLTPDSFSDGGRYMEIEAALKQVDHMIKHGVDIIDLGGESTRPFAKEVEDEEQLKRILPVLKALREQYPELVISIDTRSAKVAKECIEKGANIINDVSSLTFDPNMIKVIADYQVPIIIVHSKGTPETMQINPEYDNLVDEIFEKLLSTIESCINKNVLFNNIIIDPGVGFGKKLEDNIELIQRISEFKALGCPLLVGASRKRFIRTLLDTDMDYNDSGTAAISSILITRGADILRVHDVELHSKIAKVTDAIVRGIA